MANEKMEGCPWCGSTDVSWTMLRSRKKACVACSNCHARGPVVDFELVKEPVDVAQTPAIAAWNTRTSPTTTDDAVEAVARIAKMEEALRDMLDKYTSLVNCGDCGFWDPELEPEVIAARAAIAALQREG